MAAVGMLCTFTSTAVVPPVHFNRNLWSGALKTRLLILTSKLLNMYVALISRSFLEVPLYSVGTIT